MTIDTLINKLIPINDYQHRNGFSNIELINNLSKEEKLIVEEVLIEKLKHKTDVLIIETLSYMKSSKAVSLFYELVNKYENKPIALIIASCIFSINSDKNMIKYAINSFKFLEKSTNPHLSYSLLPMFYYLKKFNQKETDEILIQYSNNSDYLLSYNAKRLLNEKSI